MSLEPSGYVVRSSGAIMGSGPTPDAAWDDFTARVAAMGAVLRPVNTPVPDKPWFRPAAFAVRGATAALLDDVRLAGGVGARIGSDPTVRWVETLGSVCCTVGELYPDEG